MSVRGKSGECKRQVEHFRERDSNKGQKCEYVLSGENGAYGNCCAIKGVLSQVALSNKLKFLGSTSSNNMNWYAWPTRSVSLQLILLKLLPGF